MLIAVIPKGFHEMALGFFDVDPSCLPYPKKDLMIPWMNKMKNVVTIPAAAEVRGVALFTIKK